jgi:hypothetical protein
MNGPASRMAASGATRQNHSGRALHHSLALSMRLHHTRDQLLETRGRPAARPRNASTRSAGSPSAHTRRICGGWCLATPARKERRRVPQRRSPKMLPNTDSQSRDQKRSFLQVVCPDERPAAPVPLSVACANMSWQRHGIPKSHYCRIPQHLSPRESLYLRLRLPSPRRHNPNH